MSLTNKLADMPKEIFFIDLLAAKKKCNNPVNEFNNTKKCIIDFLDKEIIKIIWLVRLIWAYNYYNLNWKIHRIYHKQYIIDWKKYILVYLYDY